MMNVTGDAKPLPFVEDTAVAPEHLPEYVRRFDEIVRDHGTTAGYYGHASVGCLHIRPLIDLKQGKRTESGGWSPSPPKPSATWCWSSAAR